MYNLIVLGCGRSGTSLVTGTLATAGYSTGNNNWPPDEYNPTGYYEERGLLQLNAEILSSHMPSPVDTLAKNHPDAQKAPNEARWLSLLDLNTTLTLEQHFMPRMIAYLELEHFCFKDPQFSYTLGLWKPLFRNTKFICVFRSPIATIRSIVRYCGQLAHLKQMRIDETYAQKVWLCMYKHILKHSQSGEWFFVHYEQMFDQTVLEQLEQFAQAKIDRNFPDRQLYKSPPRAQYSGEVAQIYRELCKRANLRRTGFATQCH